MCLLFGKKKQMIKGIDKSNVNQAGRDVNIGIQLADLRPLVLDMVRSELFQLGNLSKQTIQQRGFDYDGKVVEKLSAEQDARLVEKFATPDVQFVMRDSLKQYVKTGDKDDLEDQVNMLIDRLKVQESSVMKSVIEEAINTLPKLSRASVALLAVMRQRTLNYNGNSLGVLNSFRINAPVYKELAHLKPIDIAYLRQLNCCINMSGLRQYISYESSLARQYNMLFRHYGTREDYSNIIREHPELNITINGFPLLMTYKDMGLMSLYPNLSLLKDELKKIGEEERYNAIEGYISNQPLFTDQEIRDIAVMEAPESIYVFETLDREDVQRLEVMPLGAYIGQKFLEKLTIYNYPDINESYNRS